MVDVLDGLEDAEVFNRGRKMNPNQSYRLKVIKMSERISGRSRSTIIPIEFEVVRTTDPNMSVGDRVSWVPKASSGHAFLSNLLSFSFAVLKIDASDQRAVADAKKIDPKDPKKRSQIRILLDDALGPDNAFAGFLVDVVTDPIKQTQTGHDFMPVSFFPVLDED